MSEAPSVSVVIPTFNSPELLDVQLAALIAQDYAHEFEVVIADNGSTEQIDGYVANHPLADTLHLRFVDASGTAGPSYARNVGAQHATGELLLFCDQDDRVYGQWVRRMVSFFTQGHDFFSSAIEGHSLNIGRERRIAAIPSPERFQPAGVRVPVLVGCSLGARAESYRELGGMDVTYFANHDVELGFRAAQAGFRVGYLPEVLVAYRYKAGFRAGFRQGRSRGVEMARLNADYPDSGLGEIRASAALLSLGWMTYARGLPNEERGIIAGIAGGQLHGGIRHGKLRWT